MKRLISDRGLAVVIAVFCVLVAVSLVVATVALNRTSTLARSTTFALCALRQDLERRVHDGDRFLSEHPHGIPGIPARTLRQSVGGQRRTIRALASLKCQL